MSLVMLSCLCDRVIQYNGAVLCCCECVAAYIIQITWRLDMALHCVWVECGVLISIQCRLRITHQIFLLLHNIV